MKEFDLDTLDRNIIKRALFDEMREFNEIKEQMLKTISENNGLHNREIHTPIMDKVCGFYQTFRPMFKYNIVISLEKDQNFDEIQEWLKEKEYAYVSTEYKDYGSYNSPTMIRVTFMFTNKNQAMEFKLRWGQAKQ